MINGVVYDPNHHVISIHFSEADRKYLADYPNSMFFTCYPDDSDQNYVDQIVQTFKDEEENTKMINGGYAEMIASGNYVIDPKTLKPNAEENGFSNADVIPFYMWREQDPSNVSGVGFIAQGMISTIDGRVYTVWQSDHPSYTVHESLQCALDIHGHGGKTIFKLATDGLEEIDLLSFMPSPFEMLHKENKNGMTRIGVVGRGVLVNNNRVIYRWLVYPYQVEFFQSWESFKAIHVDNHDYVDIQRIDLTSFVKLPRAGVISDGGDG